MKTTTNTVYIFKVALTAESKEDEIWRKIAICPTSTLTAFHRIIFRAFDRFEEHMWAFYFGKPYKRGTKEFISHIYCDLDKNEETILASKVKLKDLPLRRNCKFYYLFDFGDCWWHDIKFLNEGKAEAGKKYPVILEQYGESPPQYPDVDEEWDEDVDDDDNDKEYRLMVDEDSLRNVTYTELECCLNNLKNSLNASEVVGYLRGIVAAKNAVQPSQYFQLFTGIEDPSEIESIEQLREITNVILSLNNKFASELLRGKFTRFRCEAYGNTLAGQFRKIEDMRAEIRGFIRGLDLGQSNLDELDDDGLEVMKQQASLDALLESFQLSEAKIRNQPADHNTMDRMKQDLEGLDNCLFDIIIRISQSFFRARILMLQDEKKASGHQLPIVLDGMSDYYKKEAAIDYSKVSRNDPCPCGSGKKYKKCCMLKIH